MSDQHILWLKPAIYWSRDQNAEVQQLFSRSYHCQTENKTTKAGHLPLPSQSSLSCTLLELASGTRINCISERWTTKQSIYNTEIAFEWQMHTVANPSDKGGDTKARQLRSGSHHYFRKTKLQTHQWPLPTHPAPIHQV